MRKMKKILAVVIAAMMVSAAACGCGDSESTESTASTESIVETSSVSEVSSQDESEATEQTEGDSELNTLFDSIAAQVTLPSMIYLDSVDKLTRYYGITEEMVEDYAGGIDSSGVGQDEIVLLKAASEDYVLELESCLQTRYDSKYAENENYNAEEAAKILACSVETNGLYVYMIISDDAAEITQVVTDAIG